MYKILAIMYAILLLVSPALASDFIEGFEDIPLADGFRQLDEQGFSFGNEESGYTEAIITADKHTKFNDAIQFYLNTLPKLGWNLKEKNRTHLIFIRDGNILEISRLQVTPLKISVNMKSEN